MSYRLVATMLFSVTSNEGNTTERAVQLRAYPLPKRDAAGLIAMPGADMPYYRTGGKGRGTVDNRYAYSTYNDTTVFWAVTEGEASAMASGRCAIKAIPTEQPATVAAPTEQPAADVVPAEQPAAKAKRVRKGQAA